MKIKKKYTILSVVLLLLLIVGGVIGYNYVYQDHRDIESESSKVEISGNELLERFKNNDGQSLLNETITVTGTVTKAEENAVTVDESVYATFSHENKRPDLNESVSIKGRCIGYDELFEIVKLDQCSIQK